MSDPEERDTVLDRAAREINEMGEVAVDTYMSCMRLGITPDEVAEAIALLFDYEGDEINEEGEF